MKTYDNYYNAECDLIDRILFQPDFTTDVTQERIGDGFILTDPSRNTNSRSNYTYAHHFFEWLMSGEKELSPELLKDNPWVKRFVDTSNLPESFSASYGWKIKEQLRSVMEELHIHKYSRRAYLNILIPQDHVIRETKTTHEYPCTIGMQFFVRNDSLLMIVNMRSNNVYSVMPYDVYNFTELQQYVAKKLHLNLGYYYHQINNAHLYKGDIRRILNQKES